MRFIAFTGVTDGCGDSLVLITTVEADSSTDDVTELVWAELMKNSGIELVTIPLVYDHHDFIGLVTEWLEMTASSV